MEAVLRHYQVTGVRRHREQLQGPCPIHWGKRDDSFRASLSKNVFHCFACQASGNVLDGFRGGHRKVFHSRGGATLTTVVWGQYGSRIPGGVVASGAAEGGTGSGKRRRESTAAFRSDGRGSFSSLLGAARN